jgi:hypothetical protein
MDPTRLANAPREVRLACGETIRVPVISMRDALRKLGTHVRAQKPPGWQDPAEGHSEAVVKGIVEANSRRLKEHKPPPVGTVEFGEALLATEEGCVLFLQTALGKEHPEYAGREQSADLLDRMSLLEFYAVVNHAWGRPPEDEAPNPAGPAAPAGPPAAT